MNIRRFIHWGGLLIRTIDNEQTPNVGNLLYAVRPIGHITKLRVYKILS
jgi:hypothetical protein